MLNFFVVEGRRLFWVLGGDEHVLCFVPGRGGREFEFRPAVVRQIVRVTPCETRDIEKVSELRTTRNKNQSLESRNTEHESARE